MVNEGVGERTALDPLVPVAQVIARVGDWIAYGIVGGIERNPKRARALIAAFAIIGLLMTTHRTARAGIILDPILNQFNPITGAWMGNALGLANTLFLFLAGYTIIYQMVLSYIENKNTSALTMTMVRTLLALFVPYAVLVGAQGALFVGGGGIIGAAQNIAGTITGFSSPTAPDTIMLDFIQLGWSLPVKTFAAIQAENLTIFSGFAPIAMAGLALVVTFVIGVLIIGVGVLIAVEVLVATLQATFSLPIAVWTLGFSGSPATSAVAASTWGSVLRVVIRFIAIFAMAALALQIVTNWEATLTATTFNAVSASLSNTGLVITSIELLFGALALAYLTMNLPKLAVAAASGSPVISGVALVSRTGGAAGQGASAVSQGAKDAARGAEGVSGGERTGDGAAAAKGLARGGLAGAAAAVIANRRN